MEEIEFQEDFRAFVRAAIPALRAVELLLLLRGQPERWWEPAVAAAHLGAVDVPAATECVRLLQHLQRHELVAAADGRVRYRPATPALAALVDRLAQAYTHRPVTLIRLIYEKPAPAARSA